MTNQFTASPQECRYGFRCKVFTKRIWIEDTNEQGHASKYEAHLVYLVPEHSDQAAAFWLAWGPDFALEKGEELSAKNRNEIVMLLGAPINGASRGSVMKGNHNFPEDHIQVMTVGVEQQIVKKNLNGKTIFVEVLAEGEESAADSVRDTDGDMHASN